MAFFIPQWTHTAKCLDSEFRRASSLDHKKSQDLLFKFRKIVLKFLLMVTLNFRERKTLGKCLKRRVLVPQGFVISI